MREQIKKWYDNLSLPKEWKPAVYQKLEENDLELLRTVTVETLVGKQDYLLNLCYCLYQCEDMKKKFQQRGIADEIFRDCISEIALEAVQTKENHGCVGIEDIRWVHLFLNCEKIFRIGCLNFDMEIAGEHGCEGGEIQPEDKIILVHIPGDRKLDINACKKSFSMAEVFFSRYFPDFHYKCFVCGSWLLDKGLDKFLKENSNIKLFRQLFVHYKSKENDSLLRYVFSRTSTRENIQNYEAKNSFQQRLQSYIAEGGKLYEAFGVRPRERRLQSGRRMIDCHYHNCQWFSDDENYIDAQKNYRLENGVEAVNVLCLPNAKDLFPNRDMTQNILAAILKLEDNSVYAQAGLFYPDHPVKTPLPAEFAFEKQAQEFMEIGFDGIKMLESKPNVHKLLQLPPDSTAYDSFFGYLQEKDIPLLWHVNDPEEFWDEDLAPINAKSHGWFYGDGTFSSKEQIYSETYAVLQRYPKLRVTFPHCFFMSASPDRILELLNTYENVSIDLSPGPEMYLNFMKQSDKWKGIFEKYNRRFLFGTDVKNDTPMYLKKRIIEDVVRFLTTTDTFNAFEYYDMDYLLTGIGLSEECSANILCHNFKSIMGEKPRPINKAALKRYICSYQSLIPEGKTKEMIMEYCENRL